MTDYPDYPTDGGYPDARTADDGRCRPPGALLAGSEDAAGDRGVLGTLEAPALSADEAAAILARCGIGPATATNSLALPRSAKLPAAAPAPAQAPATGLLDDEWYDEPVPAPITDKDLSDAVSKAGVRHNEVLLLKQKYSSGKGLFSCIPQADRQAFLDELKNLSPPKPDPEPREDDLGPNPERDRLAEIGWEAYEKEMGWADKPTWFMSEAEMDALPEPSWLLPELLPENATVLWIGKPQSFKSFLVQDIGMAVAAGVPTFGMMPTSSGWTFYGALEDRIGLAKQRRRAWKVGRGVDRPLPFLVGRIPVITNAAQAKEHTGTKSRALLVASRSS